MLCLLGYVDFAQREAAALGAEGLGRLKTNWELHTDTSQLPLAAPSLYKGTENTLNFALKLHWAIAF